MPKVPTSTLAWSSLTQAYTLYEGPGQRQLSIVPGSSAWYCWLDHTACFAFAGKAGHYTARKERKQRGTCYWYAYFAQGGQRRKAYLGRTQNLTLARLEQLAQTFLLRSIDQVVDTCRARGRVSPAEREPSEAQVPPSFEHVTGQTPLEGDGPGRMEPHQLQDPRLAPRLHLP